MLSKLGVRTVDVGCAMLSMHSIRETAGSADVQHAIDLFTAFFEGFTELDKARGADWDRLFLKDMIQHHNGAIEMVETLFASQGAVQDEDIFKFASDVHVDQITEVNRMNLMLQSMASK